MHIHNITSITPLPFSDNRYTAGRDSNEYGQVHNKLILGKVTWLLWPWNRIQSLKKTVPPSLHQEEGGQESGAQEGESHNGSHEGVEKPRT